MVSGASSTVSLPPAVAAVGASVVNRGSRAGEASGEGVEDERLEVRDELLGLRHEATPSSRSPRPNAGLDALDEHTVLGADLGVEGQHLLDPRLAGVGAT